MAEKRRRGMDLGRVLLWSAVIVEAPRWAGAMLAADLKEINSWLSTALNTGNTVSGVAMGLVNVVATAYMLDALRRERPTTTVHRKTGTQDRANWRFYGMLVFVAGLLALTPFVLAPFMVSRMTGETLEAVLGSMPWRYVWATTVVLAPIFVIGGVSFAQPGLVGFGGASTAVRLDDEMQVSSKVSETNSGKPATYGKWKTWRKVPEAERLKIAAMTVDEVVATYGTEERTAYNWLRDAKAMVGEERELTTKGTKGSKGRAGGK
jgi:MFS family permease